ncbi:MAG: glutamate mutase L [Firmicutes bacterium]|nr:glutamate mutase L [Bacillota bacterium]
MGKKRRVLAASIGECVHSLGVETFAEWLEDQDLGYAAVKLGPAVPVDDLVNKIRESRPEVVAISYRLGDLHVEKMLREFMDKAYEYGVDPKSSPIRYCFGGLRTAANLARAMTGRNVLPDKFSRPEDRHYDLAEVARQYKGHPRYEGFFEMIADDYVSMDELVEFSRKRPSGGRESGMKWSDDLLERIRQVRETENRPIIRAHIGIAAESIEPTVEDIKKVCDAHALEIVSLAPDQPSQTFLAKFIRGEEDPDKYLRGQGGVPIRSREDLMALKAATLRGNFPMTRIYSGTDELLELAKIFEETLHMPFPAVPIFFYNQLDGRGPLPIREGIDEHFRVIRWWASLGKPLEINDPHQWQLRNCSDDMYVVDHVVAGLVALKCGIKTYVMQLMFDLPPQIAPIYDLAKMRAAYELIEPLTRHFDFRIVRETRGGLSSFPPNLDMAKGHLALTTYWQMFMEPDIVHVVSYPEAHHEARAEDIIESCDIVKQVFKDFYKSGQPDIWKDPRVAGRKEELKKAAMYNMLHLALMAGYEGKVTIKTFSKWAREPGQGDGDYEQMLLDLIDERSYPTGECALLSPDNLDLALQTGLFQAPQITVIDKHYEMTGKCRTRVVGGMCRIDEFDGLKVKGEIQRVDMVRAKYPWYFDKDISTADDRWYVPEAEDRIEDSVVAEFRKQIGVSDVRDKEVLAVDFGSTFTKIATFNTSRDDVSLSYVPTTVEDIRFGLANGLGCLEACTKSRSWKPLKEAMSRFDIKLPCSSAKGGLKMVTVSLCKEESGFAAELAALTAGAKLLNTYQGILSEEQVRNIYEVDQPEIILIAGGTNEGGEAKFGLRNADILARNAHLATYARYGVPVIYAGNEDIAADVESVFREHGIHVRITGNVMPEINTFNIETVNEAIRDLFQTIIIRGKGFDVVEEYMNARFLPTPRAAFLGINLLAKGYGKEPGLGNIVSLDVGGCTTDFFANVKSNPLYSYPWDDAKKKVKRTILKTPNAPLAYRRVEGKYGMSYNAENLAELERFRTGRMGADLDAFINERFPGLQPGSGAFGRFLSKKGGKLTFSLAPYLKWIKENPHALSECREEDAVRAYLTREIMKAATRGNVGYVKETDTYFLQYGVNFLGEDCTLLLIGGPIYHKCKSGERYNYDDLRLIAQGALFDPAEYTVLRPNGRVLLDASYLVSTVGGLYGRVDPEGALRILKRNLVKLEMDGSATS